MTPKEEDHLRRCQEAGTRVEERLLTALLHFDPVSTLTVSSVKTIAYMARSLAFEEFHPIGEEASK